jgi:hypothetical protein
MVYVYEHFNDIDFTKYELCFKNGMYYVNVDNKINIYYPHYIKDSKYKVPTRMENGLSADIRYEKIEEYIKEKYEKRVSRMNKKEKPIFIISQARIDDSFGYNNKNNIEEFANMDKYKTIILSNFDIPEKENVFLLKIKSLTLTTGEYAKIIYTKLKNLFINESSIVCNSKK